DRKLAELESAVNARLAAAAPGEAAWEQGAGRAGETSTALASGLAAHFPLDEAAGTEVLDAAGRLPNGRVNGAAARAEGRFGRALSFDGSSYVDLGPAFSFDRTDPFSYGAWIYPTSSEPGTVLSRMDDASAFRGWDLYLSGGKAYVHLIHQWDKNAIRVNTKTAVSLNEWHHVFVTYDGSSKAKGVRIYVDGTPAALDVTHDT